MQRNQNHHEHTARADAWPYRAPRPDPAVHHLDRIATALEAIAQALGDQEKHHGV